MLSSGAYGNARVAADDVRPWLPVPTAAWSRRNDPRLATFAAGRLLECPTATLTCVEPTDPVLRRASGRGDVGLAVTSFANAVILQRRREIVPDATADPRFANLLEVTLFPKIRFLVGFPLLRPDGRILGALTLIDYKPRPAPDLFILRRVEQLADTIADALVPDDDFA